MAFWLILLFALEWFYPVVFELRASGASPGKRAFGLKVVMENGLPVTAAASVTRNLLRAADFLPFGFACAIVTHADAPRLQAPRRHRGRARWWCTRGASHARRAGRGSAGRRRGAAARPDDQAALIALAARAPRLTAARLDELAALAAVVSGDAGRPGRRSRAACSASPSGRWGGDDDAAAASSSCYQDEWSELEELLDRVGRRADASRSR